jgi:hypothetical protein
MTNKFCACEVVFLNATDADVAIKRLAALGITATQFPEVKDECSDDTLFYGLWRQCELFVNDDADSMRAWALGETNAELNFFEAKVWTALEHGQLGSGDCFVLLDRKPVANDFFAVT